MVASWFRQPASPWWRRPEVLADRALDTRAEIADDPTTVTVRRATGEELGPYTVRLLTLARGQQLRGEVSGATTADTTIIAEPGTYVPRRGDRVRADTGQVYRVEYVAPLQDARVEADAVYEG